MMTCSSWQLTRFKHLLGQAQSPLLHLPALSMSPLSDSTGVCIMTVALVQYSASIRCVAEVLAMCVQDQPAYHLIDFTGPLLRSEHRSISRTCLDNPKSKAHVSDPIQTCAPAYRDGARNMFATRRIASDRVRKLTRVDPYFHVSENEESEEDEERHQSKRTRAAEVEAP